MNIKKRSLSVAISALLSVLAVNAVADGTKKCSDAGGTSSSGNVNWNSSSCSYANDSTVFTICTRHDNSYTNTVRLTSVQYHTSTYLEDNGSLKSGYSNSNSCPAIPVVSSNAKVTTYASDGYNYYGYNTTNTLKPVLAKVPHYSDSDKRGVGDSATNAASANRKITVCHVPKGNPGNRHTIHISYSAWSAHKAHNASSAPGDSDQLGSCNAEKKVTINKTDPTTKVLTSTTSTTNLAAKHTDTEITHTIRGCVSPYRAKLMNKIESFYQPILVDDSVLDDTSATTQAVVTGIGQCLDNGDSSDSSKTVNGAHPDSSNSKDTAGRKTGGKGQGRDSVSDSTRADGTHSITHHIKGCQNKDTTNIADSVHGHKDDSQKTHNKPGITDSDRAGTHVKNYHKLLKDGDSSVDATKHLKDRLVVTDSNVNDSNVWKKYKTCAGGKDGDENKVDSGKVGKKKSDSGHKKHQDVTGCNSADNDALRAALSDHRHAAHASTADIIISDTAYNDASVKAAVDACLSPNGQGVEIQQSPTIISAAIIASPTIVGATIKGGTTAPVVAAAATSNTPAVIANPTLTSNIIISGATVTSTTANPTTTTKTTVTTGSTTTTTLSTTGGEVTGGTFAGGLTGGSTTGGNTTGGTACSATPTASGTACSGTTGGGSITAGNITDGTSTAGNVKNSDIYAGTFVAGTVTGGVGTGGTVYDGTITLASGGKIINGTTTGGTITGGTTGTPTTTTTTVGGVTTTTTVTIITGGTITTNSTDPTVTSGASTVGATVTGGTVVGATYTGGTLTDGTINNFSLYSSGGASSANSTIGGSGRVGWREINETK